MACPWVDNIPGCVVPGWEAEERNLRTVSSYLVRKCPLFEEDEPHTHRRMTDMRRRKIMAVQRAKIV